MALRVTTLLLLILATISPLAARAQDHDIESSLFENCEEARGKFAKLSPEQRSKLVDYFTRVVGLNTQAPAVPEVYAVPPSGKGIEPNPPALWQNMDAKRELRGKRCALELLTLAGAQAFDAVPQLAKLYSEQPLSDEIAVGIEETAATIAEQAHKSGHVPSDSVMDQVIPYLKSDRSLVAQNFLHEYLSLSLPRVLTYLSNLPEPEAKRLLGFLKDADPDGGRAMRALVDLVPKLPVESANHLAVYLPFPTKEATAPLLSDFARLAAEPSHGSNVTALLAKGCVLLGGLQIDPTLSATVARNPSLLKEGALSDAEQRCLASSIPSMSGIILGLLTSSRQDEQTRGISLLSATVGHIDAERETALFTRVKALSQESANPLRTAAIQALALFTNQRTESTALLIGLIKSSLASKNAADSSPILDAACKSAATLFSSKDGTKYAPLVTEALKKGYASAGVTTLAAKIDSLESQMATLINPNKAELSINVLNALKTRKSFNKSALVQIIEALRYPSLSTSAEALLISQGAAIVPQLRKVLLKSSTSQRLGIIALLEVFEATTKGERTELSHALTSSESCDPLTTRPKTIERLVQEQDLEGELKKKLASKVVSCLCGFGADAAQSLLQSAGAAILADSELVNATLTRAKQCDLEQNLLASISTGALSEVTRAQVITQIIEGGSRAAQIKALESLSKDHPLAQQSLPSVRKLAAQIRDDQPLAYQAVLALARLGDTQFEWPQFVRDTIALSSSSPNYAVALQTIKSLPAEVVLSEVTPALDSDNPDHVAGACRVGANLGSLAIPIVSKMWSLRERRSPTIKYAAILALLQINPGTPELHEGLKAILVNRYYAAAYSSPIQWRQSVAVVDLDKASFGTLRTVHLERLLLK